MPSIKLSKNITRLRGTLAFIVVSLGIQRPTRNCFYLHVIFFRPEFAIFLTSHSNMNNGSKLKIQKHEHLCSPVGVGK